MFGALGMGAIARAERVGQYELVKLLGEGGMGTVWLAHPQGAPDHLFAVKTVSPRYASDLRVCTMFLKEARLAAAIDHPNVVRLYDVGLHDDVPFFVMEWVDGFRLRDVARTVADTGQPVPPGVALRIASDLCAGLHAAHELRGDDGKHLGLVHRDVSPHNVLVTREGVAKLIDFGVAKARDLATGSEPSISGGLRGKVRYMAPEQALEGSVDRRADLFSVGAIAYQLLTGRAPFEGPNDLATINALLATTPVFIPDDLPEPVQWILHRALARRPENRFADAEEMMSAIDLALIDLGLRDQHADVAECLAWFAPRDEDNAFTSTRGAATVLIEGPDAPTEVDRPAVSQPPPPLAFTAPAAAEAPDSNRADAIPAPQPPLPGESVVTARRQPTKSSSAGSLRFVLAGAGFVGVLGLGAVLLVQAAPPARKTTVPETVEIDEESVEAEAEVATAPAGASTTTPIIDMGDLEDKKRAPGATRRTKRPPHPPATIARPAASASAAPTTKTGDLIVPLKLSK